MPSQASVMRWALRRAGGGAVGKGPMKVEGESKPAEGVDIEEGPLVLEGEEPEGEEPEGEAVRVLDSSEGQVRPRKEKSGGETVVPKRGKLSDEEIDRLSKSDRVRAIREGRI